jgi:hypothetical protein
VGGRCRHAARMMMTSMSRYGPVDRRAPPSRAATCSIDRPSACGAGCSGRGLVTADMPIHASMSTLGAVGGHGGQPGSSSGLHPARAHRTCSVGAASRRWLHGDRTSGSAVGGRASVVQRVGGRASMMQRVVQRMASLAQAGAGASDEVDNGKRKVVAPLRDLLGEKVCEQPASPRCSHPVCVSPNDGLPWHRQMCAV